MRQKKARLVAGLPLTRIAAANITISSSASTTPTGKSSAAFTRTRIRLPASQNASAARRWQSPHGLLRFPDHFCPQGVLLYAGTGGESLLLACGPAVKRR